VLSSEFEAVALSPVTSLSFEHAHPFRVQASALSSAGVTEELDGLSTELDAVARELGITDAYSSAPVDAFTNKMGPWRESAARKVEALRASVASMLAGLSSLYAFFGESYDPADAEALLKRMNAFTISFCKVSIK